MKPVYCLITFALFLSSCTAPSSEEDIAQMFNVETQKAMPILPEMLTPYASPIPSYTSTPTETRSSTATLARKATQAPTITPSPIYSEPVVMFEISGVGETVTNDYVLEKCFKAVYYWSVSQNNTGKVSFTLNIHQPKILDSMTLVNVDTPNGLSEEIHGSGLQGLMGGKYYYSIENTESAWTIRLECQDNVAPVETGMNIQATGWFVSDNYVFSACQMGIFSWSVQPDINGTASLVMYFCDLKRCTTMVNEVKQDMTTPLTGQVTAMLQNGIYFIGAKNTIQPWSVSWECKD